MSRRRSSRQRSGHGGSGAQVAVWFLAAVALAGCRAPNGATGEAAPEAAVARDPAAEGARDAAGWRALTAAERRVIVDKGTEPAFSGALCDKHADGVYRCKRCGAPLFSSRAKFDSGTGWPSFDQALPGAVREVPDADGRRVEIVCAKCGAHLGHVFRGEHMTGRDTRHCVNSVSLSFETADSVDAGRQATTPPRAEAYFAGGCFWGVEALFEDRPGVLEATSGYMGGTTPSPTYSQVSSGFGGRDNGYAETVKVVYDPTMTSYEALARWFFTIHDPTQVGRQGPDVGAQYRSVAFVSSPQQRETIQRLIKILRSRGYAVATAVEPAGRFWRAEDYHQDHYRRLGGNPYCHAPVDRFGSQ